MTYRNVHVLQKPYQAEPLVEHLMVRLLTGGVPLREGDSDLPPPCRCQDTQADGNRFRSDRIR